MAKWIKCMQESGREAYVNLDVACSMVWIESKRHTIIAFPADEEPLKVKEPPAELMQKASQA